MWHKVTSSNKMYSWSPRKVGKTQAKGMLKDIMAENFQKQMKDSKSEKIQEAL